MHSKTRAELQVTSQAYILFEGKLCPQTLDLRYLLQRAEVEPHLGNIIFPTPSFEKVIKFMYENIKEEYGTFPYQDHYSFLKTFMPTKPSVAELIFVEYSARLKKILGTVVVTISRNLKQFKTVLYASNYHHTSLNQTYRDIKRAFSKAFAVQNPHVFMEISYYMVEPHLRKSNSIRVGEHLLKSLTRFKQVLSLELHEKIVFFGGMHANHALKPRAKPLFKRLPKSPSFLYPGDQEKSVFVVSTL